MQQPRFAAQHSVIVRGTWCPTTNLTITMTILKFNLDSMDQATMMAPYVNKVSLTTLEWNDDSRSHVLPPHGLNPWEDAALPPHELNRWEDSQHKHLSYHHMHSNMGRTLNLPPHELNHREVRLLRTTSVNHSAGGTSAVCIKDIKPFQCHQTYLIPILHHDCSFINKIESEVNTMTELVSFYRLPCTNNH